MIDLVLEFVLNIFSLSDSKKSDARFKRRQHKRLMKMKTPKNPSRTPKKDK